MLLYSTRDTYNENGIYQFVLLCAFSTTSCLVHAYSNMCLCYILRGNDMYDMYEGCDENVFVYGNN